MMYNAPTIIIILYCIISISVAVSLGALFILSDNVVVVVVCFYDLKCRQ